MKKLFMKLCGQDRKLRSSQTLKPMRVITKVSRCTVETFYTEDKMTYQEWNGKSGLSAQSTSIS